MRRLLSVCVILLSSIIVVAQEKPFGIDFSGFVKTDFFYDSRQTVSIREGHFLLYPQNELTDTNGADLFGAPGFNILSIQSRLTGRISGPDAFGAKTSGMLEGAFFGHSDSDINGFRLRHAFVRLNWEKAELLMGQFWHPMFIHDVFPEVVSFNTGAPFQPFSRNPQLRFSYNLGNLKLIAAAMSQRDFASTGPNGGGSVYLRNAVIPDLHAQIQYKKIKESGGALIAGAGAGYKVLKPRLYNSSQIKVDEKVEGLSAIAYCKYVAKPYTIKLEGVYGQNLFDLTMLGGYAVKYYDDKAMLANDIRQYTTLDVMSMWFEFHTNGKRVQPGIFAGYSKNMGAVNNIHDYHTNDFIYARGSNIDYLYRLSPRISFISGKLKMAFELEYTAAAYGSTKNSLGEVQDSKVIANVRGLFSTIYSF